MKKIVALFLALVMCFALCACGGSGEPAPAATPDGSGNVQPEENAEATTLRLALVNTVGTPIYESTEWFANRVAELSDGKLIIELYGGGQLGDYTATFSEMINGTIDMCWDSVVTEYDRSLELMAAPYLVSTWDQVKAAYNTDSWLGKFCADRYLALGVRVLGYTPGGFFGVAGNSVGDLNTIWDLDVKQNAVCRVPPMDISLKTMEALNYNTTTVNYSDLYTALQTGVADCWMGGSVSTNYENFRDVIKYYVAYNYMNEMYPLSISEKTWNKLPEEFQNILVQAGKEATENAYNVQYDCYYDYFDKLEEAGITVLEADDATINEIAARVREYAWPSLEEVCGAEVMEELYAFVEDMNNLG